MGCVVSKRIRSTAAPNDPQKADPAATGSPDSSRSDIPSDADPPDDAEPPLYFSFASFILQNEDPILFEWRFHSEVGKGSMSRVFRATNTETGQEAAAKVYNKSVIMRQTLTLEEPLFIGVRREIDIMVELDHRYILPIIEVIEDDSSNSLILIMPFAAHGTLTSYMRSREMTTEDFAVCLYETAEAIRYLHSMNVVHRDLKPDNVLVFSPTVFCLSDFGVSTKLESPDQRLVDTKGSPAFLSPEECGGDTFLPKPADVWAFGVMIYHCLFKKLPFRLDEGEGKTVASTVYGVGALLKSQELEMPAEKSVPQGARDLMTKILKKNPADRPTFEDVLKDPWFESAKHVDETNLNNINWASDDEGGGQDDELDLL
jgi:serine/threonine protein kinase